MELRSTKQSIFKSIDWPTLLIYSAMIIAGVISIYAASYDYDNASLFDFGEFSGKQIRWAGLSFVLGLVLLLTDSRMYETYAYPIYLGLLLLLFVTIFIAPDVKGSHSWIVLGPMSLQPAEFAKFAIYFKGFYFLCGAKKGQSKKKLYALYRACYICFINNYLRVSK